jgi:hypothetical protein
MADFYPLIARAVARLTDTSNETRQALYERARAALLTQLHDVTPPLSKADIVFQRLALEEAIRKVEAETIRYVSYSSKALNQIKPPQSPAAGKPAAIASSLSAKSRPRPSASVSKVSALWKVIYGHRRSAD